MPGSSGSKAAKFWLLKVEQIYTVLGGFHLSGTLFEAIIPQTIEALQQFNPGVVVPAHCTGWRATQRIAQVMPEAYTPNSVGTTFVLMGESKVRLLTTDQARN